MADNIGINRVPTNEELQDYKQVGGYTPKMAFLAELAKIEAVFTKAHKPFDGQCAKLDFADRISDIEKESERKWGFVKSADIRNAKFDDLDKYGDEKRFELVEDDEELEQQNINGTKTAIVTGHTVKYVCKERGHGCSVFIPMDVYTERFLNKKPEVVAPVK